jgi:hypothetical protein
MRSPEHNLGACDQGFPCAKTRILQEPFCRHEEHLKPSPEEPGCLTLQFVRFKGLRGSRSIISDVLRTKPEGEQAVGLGPDDHTSRSYNSSFAACVVSCLELTACCCVTQHMFLALNAARHGVYSMLQTNEMIGRLELTGRWSLIWANK